MNSSIILGVLQTNWRVSFGKIIGECHKNPSFARKNVQKGYDSILRPLMWDLSQSRMILKDKESSLSPKKTLLDGQRS